MKKLSEKKQIGFDVLYKSLIGKNVEIIDSNNKNQVGKTGLIVYESQNMFYLEIDGKINKILKSSVTIKFDLNGQNVKVNCMILQGTLQQRIKKIK